MVLEKEKKTHIFQGKEIAQEDKLTHANEQNPIVNMGKN